MPVGVRCTHSSLGKMHNANRGFGCGSVEGEAFSKSVPDTPVLLQPPVCWRAIPPSPLKFRRVVFHPRILQSPAGVPAGLFCFCMSRRRVQLPDRTIGGEVS